MPSPSATFRKLDLARAVRRPSLRRYLQCSAACRRAWPRERATREASIGSWPRFSVVIIQWPSDEEPAHVKVVRWTLQASDRQPSVGFCGFIDTCKTADTIANCEHVSSSAWKKFLRSNRVKSGYVNSLRAIAGGRNADCEPTDNAK